MIPDIGLIIAAYTITRLISMMSQREIKLPVKVLSGGALLATLILVIDLVSHTASIPPAFR